MVDNPKDERQEGKVENAAQQAQELKADKVRLPPPSPAHRAAIAQSISNSLSPPPKATSPQTKINCPQTKTNGPETKAIGQTEMKKTRQSKAAEAQEQEQSIEIDLGDGQLSSRRNPLTESGNYVGKMPRQEKKEPVVAIPQARSLSANAARLIAKRRAMMEGQDQAGSFKLPGSDKDDGTTGHS